MLDTDTKRRIDTARDILVGKVPDPKSQVEQITIALIYKFMDDMDAESEEFGGKRKFFAKEFGRYGWAKLMRGGLGGHEMLNLYGEAIAKMPENPGIPPLFRDIFKNAYLPYRDYLRTHNQPQWDKSSKEALYVRKRGAEVNASFEAYREFIETRSGPIVANIHICLIHQTNYLLDQQIRRLEQDFMHEGGLRERMTRARLATRAQQQYRGPHAS